MLFTPFYYAEIFTAAAELKASTHLSSDMGAPAWPHVEGLNNIVFKSVLDLWASVDNCTDVWKFWFSRQKA